MTEERLQEIKDSVGFQYAVAKAKGVDNTLLFTNEEEELIEEVERLKKLLDIEKNMIKLFDKDNQKLHSIIKEAREYIENDVEVYYVLDTRLNRAFDKTKKVKKDLLKILDKVGKENDIEFDVLKALNTDLNDDVEMG